jgi:hypothetical protein
MSSSDGKIKYDIDGKVIHTKKKVEKKKGGYRTYLNWQDKQLDNELSKKLPNEFRGSLNDYNHRSCDSALRLDDDDYANY